MKDKFILYGVISASVFTALLSIGVLYYSTWLIESFGIPKIPQEEMRASIDSLIEKVKAGEVSVEKLENLLNAGYESYEANIDHSATLISIQEGLAGVLLGTFLLYLVMLYFFARKRS